MEFLIQLKKIKEKKFQYMNDFVAIQFENSIFQCICIRIKKIINQDIITILIEQTKGYSKIYPLFQTNSAIYLIRHYDIEAIIKIIRLNMGQQNKNIERIINSRSYNKKIF